MKQTVRTLDTKVVEGVIPGSSTNPDNVKRVEFILSEENYEVNIENMNTNFLKYVWVGKISKYFHYVLIHSKKSMNLGQYT